MSFVRAQSAADLVAGLASRGLVTRTPDPSNRRRLLLELSPDGREFIDRFDAEVARIEGAMLADFTADERGSPRSLLWRARHGLETAAGNGANHPRNQASA